MQSDVETARLLVETPMLLPDLCLSPHEVGDLASGELLCAPADERVRVESGPRAGDYLVRFLNTHYGGKIQVARRELPLSPLLYVINHEFSGDDSARKIEGQLFNRLLYFDGDIRLNTAFNNWVYSLVMFAGDRGDVEWNFRPRAPLSGINLRRFDEKTRTTRWLCPVNWTSNTPDEQIERDLNQMLRDKDSYFALAHDWNFSSEGEQARRLARLANGDWDELMCCLRNLVLSFDELDASAQWTLSSRVPKPGNDENEADFSAQMLRETHLTGGDQHHGLTGVQAQLFEAIARYFHPAWNLELNDLLVRHEIRTGQEINFPFKVTVPAASAHPRLEARLQLRDFLRDKIGAPELAALMGEL